MNKKRKIKNSLICLIFIFCFLSPVILTFIDDFGNSFNPIPSTSNYLYRDRNYEFNLDDFYDDEDLYKNYTGAKFQTEAFNGTSLEWSGVVNNDTVTPVNNTESQYGSTSGVYNGTYSFTDDDVGGNPAGWMISESGGSVNVIAGLDGHKKVVELNDTDGVNSVNMYNIFTAGSQTTGTIEIWIRGNDVSKRSQVLTRGSSAYGAWLNIYADKIQYFHTAGWHDATGGSVLDDTWYHFKIVFDCNGGVDSFYDFYLNGTLLDADIPFANDQIGLLRFYVATDGGHSNYKTYIDAVGFKTGDFLATESFDYTTEEGVYYGTYDFRDDDIGGNPAGWDITETGGTINVIAEKDGHKKVLEFYDDDPTYRVDATNTFATQTNSTIEFWWTYNANETLNHYFLMQFKEGDYTRFYLCLNYLWNRLGSIQYRDSTGCHPTGFYDNPVNNTVHIKLIFDDYNNSAEFIVDGISYGELPYFSNSTVGIDKWFMFTRTVNSGGAYWHWIDAIGYDFDTTSHSGLGYEVGWNINPYDIEPLLEAGYDLGIKWDTSVQIVNNFEEHSNVLKTYDNTNSGTTSAIIYYSSVSDPIIEFWAYTNHTSYSTLGISGLGSFCFLSNNFRFWNGTDWEILVENVPINNWYHLKFVGDSDGDLIDIYIDGILEVDDLSTSVGSSTYIYFYHSTGSTQIALYIDALGIVGVNGYEEGDNLEGWDKDYTIGENLYPDNMIKGSYDYTDNMKVNDESYTTFTSTYFGGYLYKMPSQWSDFTFTKGTGDVIGELETIDGDYSTIVADSSDYNYYDFTIIPDDDGSPLEWTRSPDSGDHWDKIDEDVDNHDAHDTCLNALSGDLIDVISCTSGSISTGSVYKVDVRYVSWSSQYPGSEPYIDINLGGWKGYKKVQRDGSNVWELHTHTWTGLSGSQADVTNFQFRFKSGGVEELNRFTAIEAIIYYKVPIYKIDVQVDWQVVDPDCSSIEYLKYSHKTESIAVDIDLDIWNWDTSEWYEIESVANTATFDDDSFTLGSESVYVNSSFGVRIRFQSSDSIYDFELWIDRLRLDYTTVPPVELEFTIMFSFAGYIEDLLAMTIQSWQKSNESQIINFSIWNFDTESYVQISSSSDTSFTNKEYNTISPNDFISPTGSVKLYWIGSNNTNDFELQIDYLYIQIYYKLDLVHSKSFDTNGIYRYRWAVLGSIHYTQWVVFEIIDPVPNFHAISESDATTRWILQNATLTPVENFTDDISGSNWYLDGVGSETFEKSFLDSTNYLLDNYTLYGGEYTGVHWDVGTEDFGPEGITWDGTHFWVSGGANAEVYQYTAAGDYTTVHFDTGTEDVAPSDITWDGTHFWITGVFTTEVYQYTAAGDYTGVHFDTSLQDNHPIGIVWDGTSFWVVGHTTNDVFEYNATGVFTGTSFDVGTEDTAPVGIAWDGTTFWVYGHSTKGVYQYTAAGDYTTVHFDTGTEDVTPEGIVWDGSYLWTVGNNNDEVFQYTTTYTISKKYQGGGYVYMQTNITETIALQSTAYGTNYTLSSGDYFEVDFQTSSDSLINLILLRDGVVNKTLTLSQSGNTNFNNQTVQISVDEDVEFDQLKISSIFGDTDYVRVYDIKTYKYILTGDYADFYVGSKNQRDVYMNPDTYNLRIFEESTKKVDTNITIGSTDYYYVYTPTETLQCRLTLFNTEGNYLEFTDYHIKINRSLGGEYNELWLLDNIFLVDEETYIYINIYDRFNTLIDSFERLASNYIDLEIEVFSLQIKNLMEQETTVDINSTHVYPLLSGDSLYFMLAKDYYQIGYYDEYNLYKNFTIYLDSNEAYQLNSSLKTIYFSMFTYDGLGIDHDLVRFYINDNRKDFGFYSTLEDSLNLVILDFFNNTLANETIDANAYDNSEYNLFVEIYSLIIMNQFTYDDIIVNISQVGSGVWMTQIIPKQFGFMYRFLPNVNYTINVYFTNETLYSSRVINLTDNSHIESFGVPTTPSEYPKDVYFGVYTSTGLGINHDIVRFYIDGDRADFGFNRIEDMVVLLTVKDYFNTTLFNQNVNTSGIYEYNILITLFSLKIKNEARETSNYTLKLGGLETTGLIISQEIIEYQLATNNYVFEFTNNEDDSFHTININLNENKVYIINSTHYTAYFGLFDQYNHRLDNSLFSLYLNGTRKDFGFIELSSAYYNITVYDWLNISVFNQIIYLFNYTEYNIYITVFELQIRHLAQENSNFSLYETTTGNHINFSMAPDTLTSYMLSNSTYNVTWVNGENMQTSYYYITLDSNYILTLSSTYRGVYFALFTYDGIGIDHNLVKFYINESRKDFGFNMMTSALAEIVVLDFFNTTIFNQTIDFSSLLEYNVFIEAYSLIALNQFTYEDIIVNITQVDSGIWLNHIIPKQFALSCRFTPNMNYTFNVYYVNESLYTTRTINLTENNHIESFGTPSLPLEYPKNIYFSVYSGTGLAIDQSLLKFYINGDRADFGFNTIENVNITITVKDFFNTTLFSQIINTSGIYEYDILITIYSLKIRNEARLTANYTLNYGLLEITGFIFPEEIIEYQLFSDNYVFDYTNNEDGSLHTININLNQNRFYILNTTYYNIYFSLCDLNLHLFHPYQYVFSLNGTIHDFGLVVDLQSDDYNITVKDRFGTYLFNSIVNLRGLNEYRIDVTLYELQIRHLATENSNLNLTEDVSGNDYSFIMTPNSIKSIVIGSSDYTLNWTNGEDAQISLISIALTEDRVIMLNTSYYNIYFGLFDVNLHIIDPSQYFFRLNGTIHDFGLVVDLQSDDYNITVKDRFGTYLFNSIVNLRGLNEYRIDVTLYELQIRHLATANSNMSLYETTSHNSLNFSMAPNTIKSFILANSTYNVTWVNGENLISTVYDITLNSDYILTLNSTYYTIYFSLYDQGSVRLDDSLFSLYVNNTRKDFGFVELESDDVFIVVYDYLNITVFNQIIALRNYMAEYNIYITIFELQIRHLGEENSNISLYETTTHNHINFSMSSDSLRTFILANSSYNCTWINGENLQTTFYEFNLSSNYILTLPTTYYEVYISVYNFDGLGLEPHLFRFYINNLRRDFGFNTLKQDTNTLRVSDYFNQTLFNSAINLQQYTEYSIYVEVWTMILYNNYSFPVKINIERNDIEVEQVIEAGLGFPYRMLPKVEYVIKVYHLNETLLETREIELDENNKVVSFGFFSEEVPWKPDPLINSYNNIIALIVLGVGIFLIVIGIVIYLSKQNRKLKEKRRNSRLEHKLKATTHTRSLG